MDLFIRVKSLTAHILEGIHMREIHKASEIFEK